MKNKITQILVTLNLMLFFAFIMAIVTGGVNDRQGATNFDYIVFGSGNYGTDPNPGKDITGQNDNWISNDAAGTWSLNGALGISSTLAVTGASTLTGGLTGAVTYDAVDTAAIDNDGATNTDTLVFSSGMSNIICVGNVNGDTITQVRTPTANKIYVIKAAAGSLWFIDGGNMKLGGTRLLDNVSDRLTVVSDGTNIYEIGFVNND